MAVIIKGDVHGDVISDGGVKNETHYHYGGENLMESNIKKQEMHQETNNTLNAVPNTQIVTNLALTLKRQFIFDQMLDLAEKGEWTKGATVDDLKAMLKAVLGQGEIPLTGNEAGLSETLWQLLEKGRGDRVKIVWQNMLGYFADRHLLPASMGAPALNKMFFGDETGYTNIDKGRPSKNLMTADFESLLPLLDTYVPKVGKKA